MIHDERITGRIKFPTLWLYREGLNPAECRLIRVAGESMEPTLPDECSVLINREPSERRHGRVFVIRVGEDEIIVRRTLGHPEKSWLSASDNPDKSARRHGHARRRDSRSTAANKKSPGPRLTQATSGARALVIVGSTAKRRRQSARRSGSTPSANAAAASITCRTPHS